MYCLWEVRKYIHHVINLYTLKYQILFSLVTYLTFINILKVTNKLVDLLLKKHKLIYHYNHVKTDFDFI